MDCFCHFLVKASKKDMFFHYIIISHVCFNVSEMKTFISTVTHGSCKINHCFDCNNKCLMCLLSHKTCLKQYAVSTTDCFRYYWNNYKCNDREHGRGEACLQEYLFEHFNSEGHNGFLLDILSKCLHVMLLMLKMISKLQFVFMFYWYHVLIFYLLL